jgi:glycosyltransferase involved in cell wall biosynthesis
LNSAPSVSVVIPVFNAERYVAAALTSVLSQSVAPTEVIVVDDGATDRSLEEARRVADGRCHFVSQTRGGAAAARNAGVGRSSGSLLAFLDADDAWPPDTLRLQLSRLQDDAELDMVFGHYVSVGPDGALLADGEPRPGYSLGTMLIRRDSFLKVGPFATGWRVGEFLEWFARATELGLRHAMLPETLLHRRVHTSNLTGSDRAARVDYARIVREMAARRGQLGGRRASAGRYGEPQ